MQKEWLIMETAFSECWRSRWEMKKAHKLQRRKESWGMYTLIAVSSLKLRKGNVSAGFTISGSLCELQREQHQ
jgi:hypothetical protein